MLLIVACLLQIVTIVLINFQWYSLSRQLGEKIAFRKLFYINMMGTFVESITPSVKAGGEATKVMLLKREIGFSTGKSAALVMLQKIISITIFLVLNIVSMIWFSFSVKDVGANINSILFSCFILIAIIIGLIFFTLSPGRLGKLLKIIPLKSTTKEKLNGGIEMFTETIKQFALNKKGIYKQVGLSIFIWSFFALKAYFIARSLDINISFVAMAVVTYLTYMVGMLPLLPGGIGTFEGSMILLLIPMGVEASNGMALALTLRFVTFWFVFIFSGIYLGCSYLVGIKTPTESSHIL